MAFGSFLNISNQKISFYDVKVFNFKYSKTWTFILEMYEYRGIFLKFNSNLNNA